jgi:mannose-1-phosphate guanylyltransferase/mannose-6-phosphate isomerase
MSIIIPIILAGGEGSRLWPLSSPSSPKQFLKIIPDSDDSLLQATAKRALMLAKPEHIITVAAQKHQEITNKQLKHVDKKLCKNIILEPCRRNTAPAIAAATIYALEKFHNPILWVMPSDHIISNNINLQNAIEQSLTDALNGKIGLFGITPSRADSNYGYIIGDELLNVEKFIEKPQGDVLQDIMAKKNKWWNSGMFLFLATTLIAEMKRENLATFKLVSDAYIGGRQSEGFILDSAAYEKITPIAIDRMVMEKSKNLKIIPVDIGWKDIGSWQSLCEINGYSDTLNNLLSIIKKAA